MRHVTDELTLRVLLANDPTLVVQVERQFDAFHISLANPTYHGGCLLEQNRRFMVLMNRAFGTNRTTRILVGHNDGGICYACGVVLS